MKRPQLKIVRRTAPKNAPFLRGIQLAYRPGEVNRCPGCGRSHWQVGRASAECGFCAFALPIVTDREAR